VVSLCRPLNGKEKIIYLCVLCVSAVNTGFLGIAVWTGLTGSTGRYIVAMGYSSNSAFDNENGTFGDCFILQMYIIKDLYM